jgi:hypothetical protein
LGEAGDDREVGVKPGALNHTAAERRDAVLVREACRTRARRTRGPVEDHATA